MTSGDLPQGEADRLAAQARALRARLTCELELPRTLGDFRLIREIGRGGAGVVYEAIQLSLDRPVALKVLPAELVQRTAAGTRILHEARAAGRLRHQGIVTVFSAGEERDLVYFAMDLVRGPSLAEQISRHAGSPETAATVVHQVATSLEHAHEAGFIHRDIKPENILLETDGRPRITDFGLVYELADGDDRLTTHILGTPAYMAPEQAVGGRVDVRTDVYGLGSVLYAMLAGEAPYSGGFAAEILEQVRSGPPQPLAQRAPATPGRLVEICERAMARDPDERYSSARELANELDTFLARPRSLPRRVRYVLPALLLAGLLGVVGLIWVQRSDRLTAAPPPELGLLRGSLVTIPAAPGRVGHAALSPDGDQIVHVVERDGVRQVVQVPVDPQQRELLAPSVWAPVNPDHRDALPAPDGQQIATGPRKFLEVIDANGERRTFDDSCLAISWSPDSRKIACRVSANPPRLRVIDLATGNADTLFTGTTLGGEVSWSPHGQRIVIPVAVDGRTDLATISAEGGGVVPLTEDDAVEWGAAWSPDGTTVYFGSDRGGSPDLWSIAIDEESGQRRGDPQRLTRGLLPDTFRLSSAPRSELLLISSPATENISRVAFDPQSRRLAGAPTRDRRNISFARYPHRSPADGAIVFSSGPDRDLRILDTDAASPTAWRLLTDGPARDEGARWSPAGDLIAFHSDRSGSMEIWTVRPDGADLRRRTDLSDRDATFPVWSPDGRSLAFGVDGGGSYLLELDVDGAPIGEDALVELPPFETPFVPWSWSDDGARLVGVADGLVMYSIPTGSYERLTTFGESPLWIDGARALLFVHGNEIHALDLARGTTALVHSFAPNHLLPWLALSQDGTRLDYAIASPRDEVMLVDFRD